LLALGLVPALELPVEELVGGVLPDSQALQAGVAFLLSAVVFKPFAALITVELTVELDRVTPA
jgi:hypothetical protein